MKKQSQKNRPARGAKNTDRAAVILSLFREFPNNKFSLKHLASASGGATKEGRRETFEILGRLHDEGIVEECAREKYRLTHKHLPHFEGIADMTASGSVYVRVEGEENDIFVNQRNTANALNGDRVEVVAIHRGRDGKFEGEITRIVERSRKPYVGVAEVGAHQIFVRADSRRMPMDIYLSKKQYPDVKDGEKVVVRIADWAEGSKSPVGELVERLGMAGNNDTEMHAILAEYELPYRFDPEIEQAAEAIDGSITAKEIAARRDFRQVTTFTVDPADAKDFDDALSVRRVRDGVWEIGVHIADVTHYVRPQSTIDDEAVERGTSVYLVDRTVPMLPERLSNELCSLRPHETSLCFSAVFTLNENLDILEEWFGRTVIYSDRRFTYAEAQEVIETGRGDYAEEILTLNRLAQALRRQRFKNGAISFDREEVKFKLDETGKPLGVYFKEQKESNQMIEEFMLLANQCAAHFARVKQIPFVYRVHEEPNGEKLERLHSLLQACGINDHFAKEVPTPKELSAILEGVRGTPFEQIVNTGMLRCMSKACYEEKPKGHYGLVLKDYAHFTSPIRRYPDLAIHRMMTDLLSGTDKETMIVRYTDFAEKASKQSSEREVLAVQIERKAEDYYKAEYARRHLGECYEGIISGVTQRGIFVELENGVEGFVPASSLTATGTTLTEGIRLSDPASGKTWSLGDSMMITIVRADINLGKVDFEVAPETK